MSLLARALVQEAIEIRQRVQSRSEAISIAGELLVRSNRVEIEYVSSMIQAVEEFGPYIVIAPGIALAHGKPSSFVIETGLSLLILQEPIEFKHSQNDPVQLIFGLSAIDHSSHISLMAELADFLSNETKVNLLLNSANPQSVRAILD